MRHGGLLLEDEYAYGNRTTRKNCCALAPMGSEVVMVELVAVKMLPIEVQLD